jgi:hypothetical protein
MYGLVAFPTTHRIDLVGKRDVAAVDFVRIDAYDRA